jgi:TIR domain
MTSPTSPNSPAPIDVFISYSHKDDDLRAELDVHLSDLKHQGKIVAWHDRKITAGEEWKNVIDEHLESADIILLLISPDFMASDYCYEIELKLALKRHENGEARVIPVILRSADWQDNPLLSRLAALPTDGKAVKCWDCQDEAFLDVVEGIKWAIAQHRFVRMLSDKSFADFYPLLQQLRQRADARKHSPKVYEIFVKIIHRMNDVVKGGFSLSEVIRQVVDGEFVQQKWDFYNVYHINEKIFKDVFVDLLDKVDSTKSNSIEIPIVLLAMNEDEAAQLAAMSAFDGYSTKTRNNFKRLKKQLDKEISDWPSHYKTTTKLWQPFNNLGNRIDVESVVVEALSIAQEKHKQAILVNPSFWDIHGINDDRILLKQLRNEGCVIIMDIISMLHPAIFRSFQKSLLDAHSDTYVLIFAPNHSIIEEVQKPTAVLEFCISDLEFVKRRDDHDEEYHACQEICRELDFRNWLRDRLGKKMYSQAEHRDKPRSGISSHFNNVTEFR